MPTENVLTSTVPSVEARNTTRLAENELLAHVGLLTGPTFQDHEELECAAAGDRVPILLCHASVKGQLPIAGLRSGSIVNLLGSLEQQHSSISEWRHRLSRKALRRQPQD